MSKKAIFFALIGICTLMAASEYFLQPPKISKITPLQQKSSDLSADSVTKENELFSVETSSDKPSIIFMRYVSKNSFDEAGIDEAKATELVRSNTLFRRINIDDNEAFYMNSVVFKKNDAVITKIYEFHSNTELTSTQIYNTIYSKLKNSISESELNDININQTDLFGENSFYFNNKKNYPGMVFLIVKSKEKILAFEYTEENQENILKLINVIFQK